SLIVNVYNSGDVKSGIRIEFRAIGAVTEFRIAERQYTGVYQAEYFACSGRRFNRFHGLR
ncbi:MAG: hypothetical protein V8Q37_00245, partial [Angelakisella sp.]